MKRSNVVQAAIAIGAVLLVVALVLRDRVREWLAPPHFDEAPAAERAGAEDFVYLCPMDGFQRSDPGICGICGMPLTEEHKVRRDQLGGGRPLSLSPDMVRSIGLETAEVRERELVRDLRAVGRIAADERRMRDITARVSARIEKLHRNFLGQEVKEGEPLADLYSPEIYATQEELLLSIRSGDKRNTDAARQRLLLWGLTEAQVDEIASSGRARPAVTFLSPASGVIVTLPAHEGHWVAEGDHLMEVVDLSVVWLNADVYEFEIPFVLVGQKVDVTSPAFPGEEFQGEVAYRHPFVEEASRTQRIRVDIANPQRRLLPGMFVTARIRVPLGPGGAPVTPQGLVETEEFFCHVHGSAPGPGNCPACGTPMDTRTMPRPVTGERTVWVCGPCCPDVQEDKPGQCPKCPMQLQEKKIPDLPRALAVPRSAILDAGARRFAFVETAPGTYRRTEVVLGPRAGDFFPVKSGLRAGDKVVVRGGFLLDAQTQITSGSSALYGGATEVRDAEPAPAPGHKH